ncbi:MAG: phosphatase PAP2 family protein [Bacillota bacterium]|nr:phosphatase PAP2 family protein [Bacillota bacterium]
MDIEYLLFLQNLRDGMFAWLAPICDWASKFAVSCWPLLLICLIYWVLDRKQGKRILGGFGGGLLINGFLKLCFCVNRPWIRDARIQPYGDAKVAATGYSFPSGHSTWATGLLGGCSLWIKKHSRCLSGLLFLSVLLIMFSRNFLGVHTPQDVIVGFLSTVFMMYVVTKIEDWTDENPERDKIVLVGGLLLCVLLVLFYTFKSYPLEYLPSGQLIVDPAKMRADSFEGIGFISSYVICRYFERRNFQFDKEMSMKSRLIIGCIAMIPMIFWMNSSVGFFETLVSRDFGKFIQFFGALFYVMIFVPWIMEKVHMFEKK